LTGMSTIRGYRPRRKSHLTGCISPLVGLLISRLRIGGQPLLGRQARPRSRCRGSFMAAKSENMRAIDRAIDVLECFAVERGPLAIGELEKRAGLSRPTLYRILSTLIGRKYVRKDGAPPRYRLDIGAGRLADAWNNSLDVARLAEPLMKNL